jgi:release factor glutamine methyltransferase
MRELVKRRAAAEPVAYLVGPREFFSIDLLVRPGVFIPRPDTETLVSSALDVIKGRESPRVLDVCAGTGCVSIALAANHPTAQLTTIEIDPEVLEVTRANIERRELTSRIQALQGDLFTPLEAGQRFQVITSNPPYVQHEEIARLAADIRDHEPHLALDGGADGLDVVRRLVKESSRWLEPDGWLMIEISPEQAEATMDLLRTQGFQDVGMKQDLSQQARVAVGRLPGSRR